jgi:hypothetical protein
MNLSKSKFLAGLQCPKRLYLLCHVPQLAGKPDEQRAALFAQGHEVGRLAQQVFPSGVLLSKDHLAHREAVFRTSALMADKNVPAIFEGAFSFEDIYVRVDILQRLPGTRWRLIEVKSSTGVDAKHIPDVAIQKYVMEGCGYTVVDVCLMHINKQYEYDGKQYDLATAKITNKKGEDTKRKTNVTGLFTIQSLKEEIRLFEKELPVLLAGQWKVLALRKAPEIACGTRCSSPFGCEFYQYCHEGQTDDWVGNLPGIGRKQDELIARGITSVFKIPRNYPLSGLQKRALDCIRKKRPYYDRHLQNLLPKLSYPLYFMDFETAFPALPRYAGMHPYDQIPFQWSVHLRSAPGARLEHHEFLNGDGGDPRRAFIARLLPVLEKHRQAPIVVYSDFESRCLGLLADAFPGYADRIEAVRERLWDLLKVMRSHVYHPKFLGSFSIKAVLPALVPSMSYDNMAIADGLQAGVAYEKLTGSEISAKEKTRLRKALLAYCEQDSLAMVRLLEKLGSRGQGQKQ